MSVNRSLLVMIAGAALLVTATCGRDAPAAKGEDEIPSVVVTQWNDSTELFLEYPHLLAGRATGNWAIHLTNRKDFKPITTLFSFPSGDPSEFEKLEPKDYAALEHMQWFQSVGGYNAMNGSRPQTVAAGLSRLTSRRRLRLRRTRPARS